ncbi:MAG: HEPN domain-containing protein, partial [Bacteroidales bacterium]|jgi:HEPN domain-containing protein|nr:HEPN domain-containing protein [Bacteroidales bacterium]
VLEDKNETKLKWKERIREEVNDLVWNLKCYKVDLKEEKEDLIKYWVDISDYDLETAKSMLKSKRYLYVGFMCHQVIEKILKAYWCKCLDVPPLPVHRLIRLAEKTDLVKEFSEEQLTFIDKLEPLNIEARYPTYKEKIFELLNKEYCRKLLSDTKDLQQWIKNRL